VALQVGGQYGDGALLKRRQEMRKLRTAAASIGDQGGPASISLRALLHNGRGTVASSF